MIPRTNHYSAWSSNPSRLRILALQQSRGSFLIKSVLLHMMIARGAASRRDYDVFGLLLLLLRITFEAKELSPFVAYR
jgi:steroid 5-alpha reductase family enzyme